jgi:hypothetical protein
MKNIIFKWILLILILCTGSGNIIFADNVDTSIIKKVAFNAFHAHSDIDKSEFQIVQFIPVAEGDSIAFYIVNFNKGHIIIAADDISKPVLGFGFSTLNIDNAPPALIYLLNTYKDEILYAKKHKPAEKAQIDDTWNVYSNDNLDNHTTTNSLNYNTNSFLIETTWGQSSFNYPSQGKYGYNYYCPVIQQGQNIIHTLVGCGGVALAQILFFWSCRIEPQGVINYTPPGFDEITINLSNQNYNWYMNRDTSDIYNALFLYHCAAAIKSQFTDTATGSYIQDVPDALSDFFGMYGTLAYSTNDLTWINLLKDNINNRRPIYYRGEDHSDPNNLVAHAWVIDGYRSDNLFHCNWGWHLKSNGWYSLGNLTPDSYNFNNYQKAVLNIHPFSDVSDITIEDATLTEDDEYDGRVITVINSTIGNKSSNIFDADCITEICGPFSISIGSTLEIK